MKRPPLSAPSVAADTSLDSFRSTVPAVSGCRDCEKGPRGRACFQHALELAVNINATLGEQLGQYIQRAAEASRVPELERALRDVRALVAAQAAVLGERATVPGAALQGLELQVDALVREVLP